MGSLNGHLDTDARADELGVDATGWEKARDGKQTVPLLVLWARGLI